ncbi:MAG: DUF362 domain-containing protein, partial [Candidatus Thorarchaeota archaeon]
AKLALELSVLPEPLERIHDRVKANGMTIDELREKLGNLVSKGTILGPTVLREKDGKDRYALAQFAIGMFELQAGKLEKEYFIDAYEYIHGTFYKEMCRTDRPYQLRTIPIAKSISHMHQVNPYDDVRQLVENSQGPISLIDCICKSGNDLVGGSCAKTNERKTCIQFGGTAKFFIEQGSGLEITKQKMFELLEEFEEAGLVLQPSNSQAPEFMCACCSDCCLALHNVKRFPRPAEFYDLNYQAMVNSETCQSCGTCVERCQMEAISLIDDVAVVDLDRCLGCGLCVSRCPSGSIQLQKTGIDYVPPKTFLDTLQKIMIKKAGIVGGLKVLGKMILGRKV